MISDILTKDNLAFIWGKLWERWDWKQQLKPTCSLCERHDDMIWGQTHHSQSHSAWSALRFEALAWGEMFTDFNKLWSLPLGARMSHYQSVSCLPFLLIDFPACTKARWHLDNIYTRQTETKTLLIPTIHTQKITDLRFLCWICKVRWVIGEEHQDIPNLCTCTHFIGSYIRLFAVIFTDRCGDEVMREWEIRYK